MFTTCFLGFSVLLLGFAQVSEGHVHACAADAIANRTFCLAYGTNITDCEADVDHNCVSCGDKCTFNPPAGCYIDVPIRVQYGLNHGDGAVCAQSGPLLDVTGLPCGAEGHTHDEEAISSDAKAIQIAMIFVIPLVTFIGCLLPLFWRNMSLYTTFMSLSTVFAGGVLLGFAMIHMLPDAAEDFEDYLDDVKQFQLPYALVVFGFLLVMSVEKAVLVYMQKTMGGGSNGSISATSSPKVTGTELATKSESDPAGGEGAATSGDVAVGVKDENGANSSNAAQCHPGHVHSDKDLQFHTHAVDTSSNTLLRPLMLTFGMSFHSIFEGLALGLQVESKAASLLAGALILHKFAEGFAMGITFRLSDVKIQRALAVIVSFVLVVPIGIIIGMAVDQSVDEGSRALASSILNSFAVGVFLYVSILGVMAEEFNNGKLLPAKFALAMIGVIFMACLVFFEGEGHSHGAPTAAHAH